MDQLNLFTKRKAARPKPALERSLHILVADLLRHGLSPGWLWWHTPNGGYRTEAEAGLFQRMGTKPGVSDFLLVGPPNATLHALEIKRRGQKPSEAQRAFIFGVIEAGGKAEWIDNVDDAVRVLKGWGAVRVSLADQLSGGRNSSAG